MSQEVDSILKVSLYHIIFLASISIVLESWGGISLLAQAIVRRSANWSIDRAVLKFWTTIKTSSGRVRYQLVHLQCNLQVREECIHFSVNEIHLRLNLFVVDFDTGKLFTRSYVVYFLLMPNIISLQEAVIYSCLDLLVKLTVKAMLFMIQA